MGRREQFTVGRLDVTEGIFVNGVESTLIAGMTAAAAELNYLDTSVPGTSVASKALVLGANKNTDVLALPVGGLKIGAGAGTAISASAAEINKLTGIPATGYAVVMGSVLFTQTTGNGVYTGTIALPAGSIIVDVAAHGLVLWDGDTTSVMVIGDDDLANGFFTSFDLKAAGDLLAGEVNNIEHPGGKAGAYIAAEQRLLYSAAARDIIGVITQVGTGSTGRTLMVVTYATPTAGTPAAKV